MSTTATEELLEAVRETLIWERPWVSIKEAAENMLPWKIRTLREMLRSWPDPGDEDRHAVDAESEDGRRVARSTAEQPDGFEHPCERQGRRDAEDDAATDASVTTQPEQTA